MIKELFSRYKTNKNEKEFHDYLSTATTMHTQISSEADMEEIRVLLAKMDEMEKNVSEADSKSD